MQYIGYESYKMVKGGVRVEAEANGQWSLQSEVVQSNAAAGAECGVCGCEGYLRGAIVSCIVSY